jgi:phosphohistidine phosphatase SixA
VRLRILLVLLAGCLNGCAYANDNDSTFTLYLVRHAEKQDDGSRDPALTEAGNHRAGQLANWLKDKDIRAIWSSDYKRTRETAKPLVLEPGFELNIYDPRNLPLLAEKLLQQKENAFIVGHSNTTPELARLLCHCVIDDIDDSEYDRLIVISVTGGETHTKTLRQKQLMRP